MMWSTSKKDKGAASFSWKGASSCGFPPGFPGLGMPVPYRGWDVHDLADLNTTADDSYLHDLSMSVYDSAAQGKTSTHEFEDKPREEILPEEIKGRVLELAQTQSGSRYLQRQLTKGHPQIASLILMEVENDITVLMCDPYGNYLCQQLFQACAVFERRTMLRKLAPDAFRIACDRRGTHALQSLIGLLSTDDEEKILLNILREKVLDLSMDVNGTHVVQRILICFSASSTEMVFEPIITNLLAIAQNPYGLCVVKKCISQAQLSTYFDKLLGALANHSLDLMQSPYGNYAVQHALENWGGPACRLVVQQLFGRILQLSIQKFSSNVVEKCIEFADRDIRYQLIAELMESDKMSVLISSNYGNYVVMKALEVAEPEQARSLHNAIWNNLRSIPNKRTRQKWEKMIHTNNQRNALRTHDPCAQPYTSAVWPSQVNSAWYGSSMPDAYGSDFPWTSGP